MRAFILYLGSILYCVLALALGFDLGSKASTVGAPYAFAWASVGLLGLAATLTFPPIFERLPGVVRAPSWFLAFFVFIGAVVVSTYVDAAYFKTPAGRQEKFEKSKRDQEQAARDEAEQSAASALAAEKAKSEKLLADTEAQKAKADEEVASLERCFSAFGHRLTVLEDGLKERLNDPRSFEHVNTVATVPDADGYNVTMEFRAKNGFGALMLGSVRAKLVSAHCEIEQMSVPSVE